jgi:OmpA-OmpF porin, OOP family
MKKLKFICLALLANYLHAQDISVENLGAKVNSKYAETAPVIAPNGKTVYFAVENHPENNNGLNGSQDIWYSEIGYDGNWKAAQRAPKSVNNQEYNGLVAALADGRLLIRGAFNNGKLEGLGYSFVSRTESGWGNPQKIFIKEYDDIMRGDLEDATITPDGKILILSYLAKETGKTRDLFVCFQEKDGVYSAPLNMGTTINTNKNEFAPFIASDGVSIYFASDRKGGLGSSDIYVSKRLDDTWTNWSAPVNLGAPINTAGFDAYFTISASGDYAYMATSQNSIGASDVIKIKLKDDIKPSAVTLIVGRVYNIKTKQPVENATVEAVLVENNKAVGNPIKTNALGGFNLILTSGNKYSVYIKSEGYITAIENVDLAEQKNYTEYARNIALTPEDPSKHQKGNVYTMMTTIAKDSLGDKISRINIESRLKNLQGSSKKPVLVFLTNREGKVIQTAIVDSDGYFRFVNLPADTDYQVSFDLPDDANFEFEVVKVFNADNNTQIHSTKLKSSKVVEVSSTLLKDGKLESRVWDKLNNMPVEGVLIHIVDVNGKIIATAISDANGVFRFDKLPSDTEYAFAYELPNDNLKVNLSIDEEYKPIISKMAKKTVNVPSYMIKKKTGEGRIVYNDTKNPALVKLNLLDNNGKLLDVADVNMDGIFVFKKLPATGYKIAIEAPEDDAFATLKLDENYDPVAFRAKKNSFAVNPELIKNGVLESKVKDFRTNLPAAGVDVYLLDANGNIVAKVKTDKEGVFRFTKLPGSNYKLAFDGIEDDAFASIKIDESYVPQSILDAENAKIATLNKTQKESELNKTSAKTSGKKIARYRFENIYFDFNKDELRPEAKNVLDDLVKHIKQNPTIVVELNGHTDDTGDDSYNKKLAARRTKSAHNYLLSKGIKAKQLKEVHIGEDTPVGDNSTEEGKQLNRRIEFYVDEDSEYVPEHTVYIIKPNDNINEIAKKFGMSVEELKSKNSLNSDNLVPYTPLRVKKNL